MHDAVNYCLNINDASMDFLKVLENQMGIIADISRADILLYGRKSGNEGVVLAHAQPRSIARVYSKSREGRIIDIKTRPEVFEALTNGTHQREVRSFITEGAPVVREAFPILYPPPLIGKWSKQQAKIVACVCVVTNLIEYERHRLRSQVFRRAVENMQAMMRRGRVLGAEKLTPFGEQDGVIFVDKDGIIRYASGIAANLYRRIGYRETLIGRHLSELESADEELRQTVLSENVCQEDEIEENHRFWVRKALPVFSYSTNYWDWANWLDFKATTEKLQGVLITIHDATDIRRQDQELRTKNAMIQEIHHRVKNNLQTIAGLVRMQSRRTKSEEAKTVLDETLHRILSVAVIHEFLSNEDTSIINIKEVSYRIIHQFRQGMLSPDQHIKLELTGEPIYLPARQATACSLIINELLQNSLEHGFAAKKEGFIRVHLQDSGDEVIINVLDDGDGLPDDFKLEQTNSLGLQIIKLLAEGDLRGKIQLDKGQTAGLSVKITFPKILFQGEQGWKEHVSS